MLGRWGAALTFGLSVFLTTGCGPLPRPFQPDQKAVLAVPGAGEAANVLLLPIEGAGPGGDGAALRALVRALANHDVAAATETTLPSHVIRARARILALPGDREEVEITWQVTQAEGQDLDQDLGSVLQRSVLPAGLWSAGRPAALGSVMDRVAARLAALIPEPQAVSAAPPRALVVLPLEDAPGDGAASLRLALQAALRAAGFPVAEQAAGDNDLLVLGDVSVAPAGAEWQDIAITWFVVAAADGGDLGRIDQRNRIPAGRLDGPWGETARAIAGAAAHGIIDLLDRLRRGESG